MDEIIKWLREQHKMSEKDASSLATSLLRPGAAETAPKALRDSITVIPSRPERETITVLPPGASEAPISNSIGSPAWLDKSRRERDEYQALRAELKKSRPPLLPPTSYSTPTATPARGTPEWYDKLNRERDAYQASRGGGQLAAIAAAHTGMGTSRAGLGGNGRGGF